MPYFVEMNVPDLGGPQIYWDENGEHRTFTEAKKHAIEMMMEDIRMYQECVKNLRALRKWDIKNIPT